MKVNSYRKLAAALTERGRPLTEGALRLAVKDGRIARDANGRFDVDKCLKHLKERTRPDASRRGSMARKGTATKAKALGGRGKRATPETLTDAARRKEIALADLRELELAQKRGELVDLAEINAWVAGMIMRARDILMQLSGETRDRLARQKDPVKVGEVIDKEVRRALRELAEYKQ